MENGLDLVFLLDRSASMEGLEKDTVEGFRDMLDQQKKQEGEVRVTTILFDDGYEVLYFRKNIQHIPDMTEKEYFVKGCTALLDALGRTVYRMDAMGKVVDGLQNSGRVVFVIITDGLENSSREYTYDVVKNLVSGKRERGWEFFFLGANMDAVREAECLGISSDRSVTFRNDSEGVALNFQTVGEVVSSIRMDADASESMDGSWKEKIERNYRGRAWA